MAFKGLEVKKVNVLKDIVPYRRGQVISQNLIMNDSCDIRLFSFDSGEEIGLQVHSADILYWLQDGEATIVFEGSEVDIKENEAIVIVRDEAHGLNVKKPSKLFQITIYEREGKMEKLIKHIDHSKVFNMEEVLEYENDKVASMTLTQNDKMSLTLMSFDKGEGISTHAAGGDAMVQVLDGTVEITIDKDVFILNKGESIIMPAHIPHGLKAIERFKMFLIVAK